MESLPLQAVGVPQELFDSYLPNDPCFGRRYAKSVRECQECLLPVVMEGRLHLLNEVCKARTEGLKKISPITRLTSQDILERLNAGVSAREIFEEILGDADPATAAVEARTLLKVRMMYLQRKTGLPMPALPPTKELLDVHS